MGISTRTREGTSAGELRDQTSSGGGRVFEVAGRGDSIARAARKAAGGKIEARERTRGGSPGDRARPGIRKKSCPGPRRSQPGAEEDGGGTHSEDRAGEEDGGDDSRDGGFESQE